MLKGIATILSGTVVATVISLAALPLLSRLYSVEDFGRYQVYFSVLNILLIFSAIRYEYGLLSASNDYRVLLRLTLRLCVVTSLVCLVGVLAFGGMIVDRHPGIGAVVYILPFAMLVGGIMQAMTYIPMRERNYPLGARSKVVQSVLWAGFSFLLVPLRLTAIGLPLADMASRLGTAGFIARRSPGFMADAIGPLSAKDAWSVAKRFREYPILAFPGTLMSAVVAAMVPLAFLGLFSLEVAGQYALVERFILAPAALISSAVAQVFTGDFAKVFRDTPGDAHRVFRRTVLSLGGLGAIPALVGYFAAPFAVPLLFGPQWAMAGQLGAVAMLIAFTSFVMAPLHMVLIICRRSHLQLAWEAARFAVMLLVFLAIRYFDVIDPVSVMTDYALTTMFVYLVYLFLADRATAGTSAQARLAAGKEASLA